MSNMSRMVVSVAAVTHRYGKTRALDAVTVELPSDRMVGLLGPDGVGKSTLLGLMAGARKAIREGRLGDYIAETEQGWREGEAIPA